MRMILHCPHVQQLLALYIVSDEDLAFVDEDCQRKNPHQRAGGEVVPSQQHRLLPMLGTSPPSTFLSTDAGPGAFRSPLHAVPVPDGPASAVYTRLCLENNSKQPTTNWPDLRA